MQKILHLLTCPSRQRSCRMGSAVPGTLHQLLVVPARGLSLCHLHHCLRPICPFCPANRHTLQLLLHHHRHYLRPRSAQSPQTQTLHLYRFNPLPHLLWPTDPIPKQRKRRRIRPHWRPSPPRYRRRPLSLPCPRQHPIRHPTRTRRQRDSSLPRPV